MLPVDERSHDDRDEQQDNKDLYDKWRRNRKFSGGIAGNQPILFRQLAKQ
jgi:hypothetical protein